MGRIQDALERAEQKRATRRTKPLQLVRLEVISGSLEGLQRQFRGDSILVGRAAHADIAFDPFEDATVSAQHAEIRREKGVFALYDMGSLNGTFVNGQPVRRALLEDGDRIALGRRGPTFVFHLEVSAVQPAAGVADDGAGTPPTPRSFLELDTTRDEMPVFREENTTANQGRNNWLLGAVLLAILFDIAMNTWRFLS